MTQAELFESKAPNLVIKRDFYKRDVFICQFCLRRRNCKEKAQTIQYCFEYYSKKDKERDRIRQNKRIDREIINANQQLFMNGNYPQETQ